MPRRDDDESDSRKTKTETVTFRLPNSLIDELRMDVDLQDILRADPGSLFRKIESIELVHLLRQTEDEFSSIRKIVLKERRSRVEDVFPKQVVDTQVLEEDKNGIQTVFLRAKSRRNFINPFSLNVTSKAGYVSAPYEVKDGKLRMGFLGNQEMVEGVEGLYPSPGSYNLVFLTAGLLSAVSVGFALMLIRRVAHKAIEVR